MPCPTHKTPQDWCHACHPEKWAAKRKGVEVGRKGERPRVCRTDTSCIHRGGQVRQLDPTCASTRTFACHLHGECVPTERQLEKLEYALSLQPEGMPSPAVCDGCPDYRSKAEPGAQLGRRHLAYHVYPLSKRVRKWGAASNLTSGTWQRGLDQLRLRRELFTGRKFIAVSTGEGLDPWEQVRDYAADLGADVFPVPNNPALREVATWEPLWERVLAVAQPSDVAFYAHSKGVTRRVDPGNTCHPWASLLYSVNLDHWPHVAGVLSRFPIAGALLKRGQMFGPGYGKWHYSGTFYWVRVDDFRTRPWRAVPRQWWGTEAWPGTAYGLNDAGVIFHTNAGHQVNGYSSWFWSQKFVATYEAWIQERRKEWDAGTSRTTSTRSRGDGSKVSTN